MRFVRLPNLRPSAQTEGRSLGDRILRHLERITGQVHGSIRDHFTDICNEMSRGDHRIAQALPQKLFKPFESF